MALTARARTAASELSEIAECGIDRVVRATRRRQIEWQLDRQYAALGRAIYPLLQSDAVHTDLPIALERMAEIEALTERLVAIRAVPLDGALDRTPVDDDEERWADEGGQHIA